MALTLDIGANTRDAVRGIGQLGDALDDNGKALQELGRDADKFENKFESAMREVSKDAKRARDDVRDVGDSGFRGAGERSAEFKQEALANFSEVTSSFNGSMTSVQDLAQGTLGGLASSGLPGVSLAAGAAAVGIGLIGTAIGGVGQSAEEAQQAATDWANAYIEAGSKILGASQVAAKGQQIITDPEQFKKAQQAAKDWGVDVSTAIRAQAGDATAINAVSESIRGQNQALEAYKKAKTAPTQEEIRAYVDLSAQVSSGAVSFRDLTNAQTAGKKAFDQTSDLLLGLVRDSKGATVQVDALGDSLYTLPDGTQVVVSAETGKASQDVSKFKDQVFGLPQQVKVTAVLDDAQLQRALNTIDKKVLNVKIQGTDRYGKAIF